MLAETGFGVTRAAVNEVHVNIPSILPTSSIVSTDTSRSSSPFLRRLTDLIPFKIVAQGKTGGFRS